MISVLFYTSNPVVYSYDLVSLMSTNP